MRVSKIRVANKKFFGFLLFISGLFLIVLFMCFVFAASVAPTGLIFRNNVTVNYDEGNFTVNWTSGGGDENDYFIYISIDGGTSWFTKVNNNSLLGYSFNNHTEANYTFRIEAVNATGDAANSTIDLSMYKVSFPSASLSLLELGQLSRGLDPCIIIALIG